MKHAHGEISEKERAARWTIKLQAIFENVGLTAEGIRAAAGGASVPVRVVTEPTTPSERPRPDCLYCGRRVGNCLRVRRPPRPGWTGAWP